MPISNSFFPNKQKIIGVKSGTFRLGLMSHHIWALKQCKSFGVDHLIVLTNSDDFIKKNKGFGLPLNERLEILSACQYIDEVGFFLENTEDDWKKTYKRDRLVKEHGQHALLYLFHSIEIIGKEFIPGSKNADRIIYIPKIKGSSTKIIQEIRRDYE